MPSDDEGVRRHRGLHLRRREVDHGAALGEHINFLNPGYVIHTEALQLCLQLLVICAMALVLGEFPSSLGPFATSSDGLEPLP
eukprot:CAMPEP_0179232834 /NCGR_PEP_ID=MMETSP0797-20121207/12062_1 /TAXON_ID=47934 /ORGANISM="Dinophysis acuminata, Strain DAEP01" /LENGTH=82 /DNA_ID=CAMNT_0020939963 /DNA_START=411 /DNA_END=659 /DNA_ORIENTATION=+